MIRKLLFLFLLLGITFGAKAQQEAQFTHFMNNQLYINPAYAGARGMPSFTVIYRNQWIGFKGSPTSKLLSFNAPLLNDRVGFGLTIHNQTAGIFNEWSGTMAYAYNIKVSEETAIRVGLQGRMKYYGIDFSDPSVIIRDPTDPSTKPDENASRYSGNFGVGLHLKIKQMFFGISAPSFFPTEISFNGNSLVPVVAEEAAHFYFIAGTLLPLSKTVQFKPTVMTKFVQNAPLNMDINVSMVFNLAFTAGLSYRLGGSGSGDSVDLTALYQINNVAIGAAYDFPLSEIKDQTNGSLEMLVRFDFIKESTDMANPRFFF